MGLGYRFSGRFDGRPSLRETLTSGLGLLNDLPCGLWYLRKGASNFDPVDAGIIGFSKKRLLYLLTCSFPIPVPLLGPGHTVPLADLR